MCTMAALNSARDRLWFNGQCQSPLAVSRSDPGVSAEHFGLTWMIHAHKQQGHRSLLCSLSFKIIKRLIWDKILLLWNPLELPMSVFR